MKRIIILTLIMFLFCWYSAISQDTTTDIQTTETLDRKTIVTNMIRDYLEKNVSRDFEAPIPYGTKLEKVELEGNVVTIHVNSRLVYQPIRIGLIEYLKHEFASLLADAVPDAQIRIFADDREIEEYIPGLHCPPGVLPEKLTRSTEPLLIRKVSVPAPEPSQGLYGHYVALWHSHGWYYDTIDGRWQWQRPRLFTIVEDKLPMGFTIPFLMPMLENAGCIVFCPRERDVQVNEVLVDDGDGKEYPNNGIFETLSEPVWENDAGAGFKNWLAPYPDDMNPHQQGHHLVTKTVIGSPTSYCCWTPVIPETGRYAVYVSYNASPERATDAHYIVYHAGGATEFRVNQQKCGNYWLYLGHFLFNKNASRETCSVVLANDSEQEGATVSADCVKFGGGMGDVIRGGTISGYPRFCEGSRYWLQYAGVIPEMVYKLGIKPGFGGPDYLEDYSSRPEWVNYLYGAPNGPNPQRDFEGLGIPIDLSLAFHTDAGIRKGIVGTLVVYRILDHLDKDEFPDGRSRWLNRDLADTLSSQIVSDIRAKYSSTWRRREVRMMDFAETRRPNVPSALIELLSHQNFDDMKYGLDPRFRFDVSRAMYKAILRFIAYEYGFEPVVSPLTPQGFSLKTLAPGKVALRWEPTPDPLEPTAEPEGYILYMRTGLNADFDNGRYITIKAVELEGLDPGTIYSFRVAAVNKGGISFPSEALSVYTGTGEESRALIVNAFDRIGPPEFVECESVRGVIRDCADKGVPYHFDCALTGDTWDFDPTHKFLNNDNPGWGASYGDMENGVELGNTFDYTITHGAAIKSAGWAFDSTSEEALRGGYISLGDYKAVDWLLGEERTTSPPPWREGDGSPDMMKHEFQALTPEDQALIRNYLLNGGALFISGAYVATDLVNSPLSGEEDKAFLTDVLKCQWICNAGSKTNDVFAVNDSMFDRAGIPGVHFSRGAGENGIYGVELPDSIQPAKDSGAQVLLRYKDAHFNAAIAYAGEQYRLVMFGFPFETITSAEVRESIMQTILSFLTQ